MGVVHELLVKTRKELLGEMIPKGLECSEIRFVDTCENVVDNPIHLMGREGEGERRNGGESEGVGGQSGL